MRIYTKTGDNGTTGLFAGSRVPKSHPRISAFGTVDELNAVLGVVMASLSAPSVGNDQPADTARHHLSLILSRIQADLFSMGAELATPQPEQHGMCLLTISHIEQLERWIDEAESELAPLQNFVLPSGSMGSAMLHWARTVCRRAEREVVHLSQHPEVGDTSRLVIYLNRLSDLLFVMARHANRIADIDDVPWIGPDLRSDGSDR